MKEQKNRPIKTEGYTLIHQVTARRVRRRLDAEKRLCHPKKSITALRFLIACARGEAEIKDLLGVGETFKNASAKTKRAWLATAARRRAELAAGLQAEKSVRK